MIKSCHIKIVLQKMCPSTCPLHGTPHNMEVDTLGSNKHAPTQATILG